MKILIFGSTGYIGTEFCRQLDIKEYEYYTLSSQQFLTVTDLGNALWRYKPDVIINCSAYTGKTSIEDCESQKKMTIRSNVLFPQSLATICFDRKILLCHFSTGCLYNGGVTRPFTEDDEPILTFQNNNCSFYTGTKVMSEQLLRHVTKKYIWRIRLPFENVHNNRNYFSKLIKYDRLISAPNSISHKEDLVSACIQCLEKEVPYGTYHVTNPGYLTAREITTEMNNRIYGFKKDFRFFDSIEDYNKTRKIPTSNAVLSVDKLLKTGVKIRPVNESLVETLKHWRW